MVFMKPILFAAFRSMAAQKRSKIRSSSVTLTVPSANYSIGANFLGVGNGFPNYSVPDAPPDTTMAVGDTQIVQWVNVSYTVCSKTAPYTCSASVEGNLLWQNLGGVCASNNDGDIIAQFDVVAHRWLLTQNIFAGNYGVCVAVSTTADATGTYYLYEFPALNNGFPDYPKWGIWPTGYFETWNNFGPGGSGFVGPVLCGYNSAKLLTGDKTAEQICHQYPNNAPDYEDSLLPGDQDSPTTPPAGQDEFAIGSRRRYRQLAFVFVLNAYQRREQLGQGRDLYRRQRLATIAYCNLYLRRVTAIMAATACLRKGSPILPIHWAIA